MAVIIKDRKFTELPGTKMPDARRRIVLTVPKHAKDVLYHVYMNQSGQILLDPYIIPASEVWLYRDKAVLAGLKRGLDDAAKGRVIPMKPSDL